MIDEIHIFDSNNTKVIATDNVYICLSLVKVNTKKLEINTLFLLCMCTV